MKKTYRVDGDTKNTFNGITLELVIEDEKIGAKVNVLGGSFVITQNGKILVLSSDEWCLTLFDITPEKKEEKPKLKINENLDLFLEVKEIKVSVKCTYLELYEKLKEEWSFIQTINGEKCPFRYNDEMKLLTLENRWNLTGESIQFLTDGSFDRKSEDGRSI